MKNRFFALCLLVASALVPFTAQAAPNWPGKPITIVVSYAAGGTQDTMTRILVPFMKKMLGVDIVVKNAYGANGTIGAAEAANAKPDGHTLYLLSGGPGIIQPATRKLSYTSDSFQPVSLLYNTPHVLMVSSRSPYKTLDDFIKAARAKPNTLTCASTGVGSAAHLNIAAFRKAFEIELQHLPQRGGAEAMQKLSDGALTAVLDSEAYIPRSTARALVRFWPTRSMSKGFADIPSVKEFGKEVYFSAWAGIAAPKGTPDEIVKKLDAVYAGIMGLPAVKQQAARNGLFEDYRNTADFETLYANEIAKIQDMLKLAGLMR